MARSVSAIAGRSKSGLMIPVLWVFSHSAFPVVLDLRPGVTDMSQRIQALHHISLWVCVVVGILVFGAMFYSMFAHRRSKNPVPADFHESLTVEIIWTVIPVLILIASAGLAVSASNAKEAPVPTLRDGCGAATIPP